MTATEIRMADFTKMLDLDEREFMELWQQRLVWADGRLRGRFAPAAALLTEIRHREPLPLPVGVPGRPS